MQYLQSQRVTLSRHLMPHVSAITCYIATPASTGGAPKKPDPQRDFEQVMENITEAMQAPSIVPGGVGGYGRTAEDPDPVGRMKREAEEKARRKQEKKEKGGFLRRLFGRGD